MIDNKQNKSDENNQALFNAHKQTLGWWRLMRVDEERVDERDDHMRSELCQSMNTEGL